MAKALFRYCGNKGRMLRHYRPPPKSCRRVVEPYLGSGAYTLNHSLPGLGLDNDPQVVDLWHWLQQAHEDDLHAAQLALDAARHDKEKPDVRTLGLSRGAMLYLKLNVCGLVVGQWSSWSAYPQHQLPISRTLEALEDAHRVDVRLGTASEYLPSEGDMLFLDPPYVGTHGNYSKEKEYDPSETLALIERCAIPTLFAYGDGAPEVFPGLPWEVAQIRKVPNFRKGGTVDRTEYVAYLNWPEEDRELTVVDMLQL